MAVQKMDTFISRYKSVLLRTAAGMVPALHWRGVVLTGLDGAYVCTRSHAEQLCAAVSAYLLLRSMGTSFCA
jgi:hypothetical protein